MEIKINKEIRNYTESIFFGLSLRQFIFSLIACIVAISVYFIFKDKIDMETLSWLCILGAAPFACLGFLNYNGMKAEEFLIPKKLTFKTNNFYYDLLNLEKEESTSEKFKKIISIRKRKI